MVSWEELKDPCSSGVYLDYLEPDPSGDPVIMQYIGLKDKNGCEIYEGDILKANPHGLRDEIGYVTYYDRAFIAVADGEDYDLLEYMLNIVEIIGNIYQNPELLQK